MLFKSEEEVIEIMDIIRDDLSHVCDANISEELENIWYSIYEKLMKTNSLTVDLTKEELKSLQGTLKLLVWRWDHSPSSYKDIDSICMRYIKKLNEMYKSILDRVNKELK